jgi:translation elongation factor EF-Ts
MTQDLVDKVVELRRRTEAPSLLCRKVLSRYDWDLSRAEAYIKSLGDEPHGMLVTKRSLLHG